MTRRKFTPPQGYPSSTGYVFTDSDAEAYVAAMTSEPDDTRKGHIDTLFQEVKAAGAYTGAVEFGIFAANDEQAAALGCKRAFDLTVVGVPTWEEDRGYTIAAGKYFKTGIIPSDDLLLDSTLLMTYNRVDQQSDTFAIGARNASGPKNCYIISRDTSDQVFSSINSSAGASAANAASLGLIVAQREGASEDRFIKNGSSIGTDTTSSTGLPTVELYIGARNVDGTASGYDSGQQFAFWYIGEKLTVGGGSEHEGLFDAVEKYMDAIGAGVVA